MAEYYSKEQLLESGRTTWCDMYDLEDFLDEISAENVLQITRCKDCENYNAEKDSFRCWIHCADVQEDDFCSYAQPRTPKNDEVRE